MHGDKIHKLRVTSGGKRLWQLTGQQGDKWFKATVPLKSTGTAFHVSCMTRKMFFLWEGVIEQQIPKKT